MIRNRVLVVVLGSALLAAGGWSCASSSGGDNKPGMTLSPSVGTSGMAGTGQVPSGVGGGQVTGGVGGGTVAGVGGNGPVPGGVAGAGAGAGAAGADASNSGSKCNITSNLTMSPAISTVGTVEFSTDLPGVDSAYIEFGLDTDYGMKAPVDLAEPNYRTVLLGMKTDRQYHYRIVVSAGSQVCSGPDNTLQTGSLPNQLGLLKVTVTTPQPDKVSKGFMLMGYLRTGPTFIIDQDGDYVWWFDSGDVTRARMTYDGKYVWTQALNWNAGFGANAVNDKKAGGTPVIHRVSVDGTQVDTYGLSEFGDPTHDFDITPDGSYIMPDHNSSGSCMKIVERTPDGQRHDIITVDQADHGSNCLVNSIHYWPADDTITFSDLGNDCYVKMTRTGKVLWILGGAHSTFTQGDAISWNGEHGHHVLAPDRLLMFNNGINPLTGGGNPGGSSMVYEVKLDEATKTATRVWQYDGGLQTYAFGDVQRLPDGNTLVNYGVKGTIHEVDPDGKLVQSMEWGLGGVIAYVDWRHSLYGPPDR